MNQNKIQTKNSYKNNMKILNEQGVTIIALSVTILVMIILSGVVLNAALRDNGLIDKASQSTEKYEETQEKEEDRIQDFQDDLYDQFEDAGTEAPNQSNWDMSKVTPISDGKGNVIPVPKGFYYAGGNKSTGFVISDQEGDDLKNSAGGNQFVWIPCTASEYREAKDDVMDENWSHNTQYETNGTSTTGKGLAWSDDYTDADIKKVNDVYVAKSVPEATISAITSKWEKNQTSKAIESTGKYGGFYIARYEAGVPSNASFYINSDLTYNHTNRGQVNTAGLNAINGLSPVSKKGVQVWNYINQSNAKTVAENMYKDKNNDSVGSYLIDSQAWIHQQIIQK